ncbi:hypothetical protein HWV62_530 [Athelia sp. TMB]|nr:hypothetical protein HWV62_530 [Athelia sp. TMB]
MLAIARRSPRLTLDALSAARARPTTPSSARSYSVVLKSQSQSLRLGARPQARSFWGAAAAAPAPTSAPAPPEPVVPAEPTAAAAAPVDPSPTWSPDALSSAPDPTSLAPDALATSPAPDAITTLSTDTLAALTAIPPLQPGDLSALGLLSYTPAGLVRWTLELLHTTTHLPWFWTIAGGTLLWRLTLLPVTIRATRNSAHMIQHGPALQAASEEFKAAVARTADPVERAAAMHKMMGVYTAAGVNPRTMMLAPLLQLPVVLGLFLGIKGLCAHPLPQLTHSGLALLPDLTLPLSVADPWMVLPALSVLGMSLQMRLAVREVDPAKPGAPHVFNALRVLAPLGAVCMTWLPAGVMVSMLTTVGATLATSAILQVPRIRAAAGIPPLPANPPKLPSIMESRTALKEYLRESREKALAEVARQEIERRKGKL